MVPPHPLPPFFPALGMTRGAEMAQNNGRGHGKKRCVPDDVKRYTPATTGA